MLSVHNVTKKYGSFLALKDLSLDFTSGVYGLLAANGAGKTTLIKMLTTLLFPTKGKILWNGEDIDAMGEKYRELIGYLPQQFGYYKNYSPKQFLSYIAALKGIDPALADLQIEELIHTVGLSADADKKMRQFSGGMIQRVGIAQAMLGDPKLLILDEPTAGLDPKERVRFRNIIHGLAKNRIVILSTHIVSDIETIAHKIILIRDRTLYACETPAEVCARVAGKVFELPATQSVEGGGFILSERQSEAGPVVRIASETPVPGATPVAPNLEDAFLYLYRDNG